MSTADPQKKGLEEEQTKMEALVEKCTAFIRKQVRGHTEDATTITDMAQKTRHSVPVRICPSKHYNLYAEVDKVYAEVMWKQANQFHQSTEESMQLYIEVKNVSLFAFSTNRKTNQSTLDLWFWGDQHPLRITFHNRKSKRRLSNILYKEWCMFGMITDLKPHLSQREIQMIKAKYTENKQERPFFYGNSRDVDRREFTYPFKPETVFKVIRLLKSGYPIDSD